MRVPINLELANVLTCPDCDTSTWYIVKIEIEPNIEDIFIACSQCRRMEKMRDALVNSKEKERTLQ